MSPSNTLKLLIKENKEMKKIINYIKRRGFTDKLYFCNLMFAWIYTILCLIFSVLGHIIGIEDYSFVTIVCPVVWAEVGIHTGFIITKSKVENLNKHAPMTDTQWSGNINVEI